MTSKNPFSPGGEGALRADEGIEYNYKNLIPTSLPQVEREF